MVWSGPASADSDHTDCTGNDCVHTHCYDDGACDRTEFDARDRDPYNAAEYVPGRKPVRYACDSDGYNCHYTRHYSYNEYGEMVYDPDASPY
jgi:hypothetical protein